jgi:hypothetical protein
MLRALLLCQLVKIQTINKGIGFLSGLLYGVHKKDLGLLMSVKNYFPPPPPTPAGVDKQGGEGVELDLLENYLRGIEGGIQIRSWFRFLRFIFLCRCRSL